MKNFSKKVWGVPGKLKEYYTPGKFQADKRIVPLNANPLEAWDTARSRYRRVDLIPKPVPENIQQMDGINEFVASSPVPDVTPTNTPTPSITPSSTPYILPETPALWYDATNLGSIDYISSGGTDYVSTWRSIGTYNKAVTGLTTNTMPIWSGSSQLPGSPLIVRWTKQATTTLRQYLTQRFDDTQIPTSGITTFIVFANPGYNYLGTSNALGLAFNLFMASGNTTGGFTTPAKMNYNLFIGSVSNSNQLTTVIDGVATNNVYTNMSATSLNEKYLFTQVSEFNNTLPYYEINQSGGTMPNVITANTNNAITSVALGIGFAAAGTINTTAINPGIEIGEIMVFNRTLSPAEQEQVQDYLRDKWRYDEWASPVPTATPTGTPTQTPTQTTTMTPSPTPSAAPASGTTEALTYLERVVQSGGTVDATASAATITLFTSLVSNNLWDKMYAFYPVLGGVAASHSINGLSTGGTYDLTFNGGWTHTSSGMQPNGTNGYAETGFNPSASIGNGNPSSLGLYVNLQGTVGDRIYDMGVCTDPGALTDMWNLTAKRTSGTGDNTLFDSGDYPNARVETTSQASASGMTIGSVRATNDRTLYRNGSNIATKTTTQNIDYPNRTQIIGAQKGTAPVAFYSSNQYAFAFMGSGLTNTEIVNISSIINTYQTSLGRNTY